MVVENTDADADDGGSVPSSSVISASPSSCVTCCC